MCSTTKVRKFGIAFLTAVLLLLCGVFYTGQTQVNAATAGFVKKDGATYYLRSDGTYQKGWLKLNGKYYYFSTKTSKMVTGWLKSTTGKLRYFSKTSGVMSTGWSKSTSGVRYFRKSDGTMATGILKIDGGYYYFDQNGYMYTGWLTNNQGKKRYFTTSGKMYTGWNKTSSGKKRYFSKSTGFMATGWVKSGSVTWYFSPNTGYMYTGWVKSSTGAYRYFDKNTGNMYTGWMTVGTKKRYLDPSTGIMAVGKVTIDGVSYTFDSSGYLLGTTADLESVTPTSAKTLKNLFLYALQPVGSTLYLYGGGHNADATRRGLNPEWAAAYKLGNYENGLDCSGYIGWSIFQVMNSISTVSSGAMADLYKARGWGTKYMLSAVKNLQPGDIVGHGEHVWMIVGTCSDGSVLILHSGGTSGPQLAGTGGEATALAKSYMSRYAGYAVYNYCGYSDPWLSTSNSMYYSTYVFRWNPTVLTDPEGFRNLSADQILTRLSAAIGD